MTAENIGEANKLGGQAAELYTQRVAVIIKTIENNY
jgi:hypothetical protein